MTSNRIVFIIDDDDHVRESFSALVGSMGYVSKAYSSAEEFLSSAGFSRPGCIVADVRLPGMSGLELQEELLNQDCKLPIIMISAFASTRATVQAVQQGAITVLDKPCNDHELYNSIRKALAHDQQQRKSTAKKDATKHRLSTLTPNEREVLKSLMAGLSNKQIATELDVSIRTVEARRQKIFEKMQAGSVVELVHLVLSVQSETASQDDPDGE